MTKKPKNHGNPWKKSEIKQLQMLTKGNTPTRLIAYKLGRTEDAIRAKASNEDISLKPTNQSPYDRAVSNAKKSKRQK